MEIHHTYHKPDPIPAPVRSAHNQPECPFCRSAAFSNGYCPDCGTTIPSRKSEASPVALFSKPRRTRWPEDYQPITDGIDGTDAGTPEELDQCGDTLDHLDVEHDDRPGDSCLPDHETLERLPW